MPCNHFDSEKNLYTIGVGQPPSHNSPRSVVTLPGIVPPFLGNPGSAPDVTLGKAATASSAKGHNFS